MTFYDLIAILGALVLFIVFITVLCATAEMVLEERISSCNLFRKSSPDSFLPSLEELPAVKSMVKQKVERAHISIQEVSINIRAEPFMLSILKAPPPPR